jgi:hypothetical protein
MKLYYRIWADCLFTMKGKEGNWKISSLLIMSFLTTLNFIAFAMVLIGVWRQYIQKQEAAKLPKIDFVYFLIVGGLIFILSYSVHYFLIFYSKKYIGLLKVDKEVGNGLLSKYFIISGLSILFLYFLFKVII